jgi:hypothetical protein
MTVIVVGGAEKELTNGIYLWGAGIVPHAKHYAIP